MRNKREKLAGHRDLIEGRENETHMCFICGEVKPLMEFNLKAVKRSKGGYRLAVGSCTKCNTWNARLSNRIRRAREKDAKLQGGDLNA